MQSEVENVRWETTEYDGFSDEILKQDINIGSGRCFLRIAGLRMRIVSSLSSHISFQLINRQFLSKVAFVLACKKYEQKLTQKKILLQIKI